MALDNTCSCGNLCHCKPNRNWLQRRSFLGSKWDFVAGSLLIVGCLGFLNSIPVYSEALPDIFHNITAACNLWVCRSCHLLFDLWYPPTPILGLSLCSQPGCHPVPVRAVWFSFPADWIRNCECSWGQYNWSAYLCDGDGGSKFEIHWMQKGILNGCSLQMVVGLTSPVLQVVALAVCSWRLESSPFASLYSSVVTWSMTSKYMFVLVLLWHTALTDAMNPM